MSACVWINLNQNVLGGSNRKWNDPMGIFLAEIATSESQFLQVFRK